MTLDILRHNPVSEIDGYLLLSIRNSITIFSIFLIYTLLKPVT